MTVASPLPGRISSHAQSPLVIGGMTFVFWMAAASGVVIVRALLEGRSPGGSAMICALTIVVAAWLRSVACGRGTAPFAMGVGIAWLLLSIAAELLMTLHLGRPWTALLGPPAHPLLRNLYLFAWIFAPPLFTRRDD